MTMTPLETIIEKRLQSEGIEHASTLAALCAIDIDQAKKDVRVPQLNLTHQETQGTSVWWKCCCGRVCGVSILSCHHSLNNSPQTYDETYGD